MFAISAKWSCGCPTHNVKSFCKQQQQQQQKQQRKSEKTTCEAIYDENTNHTVLFKLDLENVVGNRQV